MLGSTHFPRWIFSVVAIALVLGAVPFVSHAQISADRPGLGNGASIVPPQTFQSELGYAFSSNGSNSHELGQLLLRYGVTDAVELRGGVGSYVINEAPFDNGYPGPTLGAKARLFQNETSTLSGIATLGLPTSTGPYDTPDDRARQELTLAFNGALGSGVDLTLNGGTRFFYSSGAQDDRAFGWLFIPTLSFGVTQTADAYVGYGGFYRNGPNTNWVEGGLTILATPNTQVDLNTGLRVDDNSDRFFLGVGLAHRF